jgi:hypothetical protein
MAGSEFTKKPVFTSAVESASNTISITNDFIAKEERRPSISCPDRFLRDSIITDGQTGELLFKLHVATPGTSWSNRCALRDASGQDILVFRNHHSKVHEWVIEVVDEGGRKRELGLVKDHAGSFMAVDITTLTAQIHTET